SGDFFVQLLEKHKAATRDGKPFYTCRFRDARRTVTCMVWADSGWFEACEKDWQEGHFYKIRGTYAEHGRTGRQMEITNLREAAEGTGADASAPGELVERSRYDSEQMSAERRTFAEENASDEPLRKLVLTILDRHAEAIKRLPATQRNFYPFYGALLTHPLSLTHPRPDLLDIYAVPL